MKNASAKHIKIKSSKIMNSLFLGNFKAAFHGKGIEFRDFREYNSGDDAKYIDWVRTSREGTTIIRRYKEEKESKILCVVDISESMSYFDGSVKKDLIFQIIDLLGNATLASGESFGGYIMGGEKPQIIKPKKDKSVIIELQKIPQKFRDIHNKLEFNILLQKSLKRSIIFVISDSRNPDMKSLRLCAKKHDVIYIHISSHFENTLDDSGIAYLQSESFGVAVNMGDDKKKAEYIKERQIAIHEFKKNLAKIGVDFISVDEKSSLFGEFLKLMKYRERK